MPPIARIKDPSLLAFKNGDTLCHGADQNWYKNRFQRTAGCGPTAAAVLLYYLAQRHPAAHRLCPQRVATKEEFVPLMQAVWADVTPGLLGVNRVRHFAKGVRRYGAKRGVALQTATLAVPPFYARRPHPRHLFHFIAAALEKDYPVAFLNRSNGTLKSINSWHWMPLIALHEDLTVDVLDGCRVKTIPLLEWLKSSAMGGGLVAVTAPKGLL